ncbi:MAG: alpha/beta fold hydrolase, partial [Opitutae bacterium]|nr:alpha/beta fold hydrolase [Opitutae bacterium]
MPAPYLPPGWLRNRWLQTGLASLRLRACHTDHVLSLSRRRVLDTSGGVRLLGFDLPHPAPKGRVVLIHGWEGSSDSTYVRTTATRLHLAGYNVFRLNLRDHGPSHHLNEGVFLAVYLDEVVEAVTRLAAEVPHLPVALCGFSLGGNFALRIAETDSKLGAVQRLGVRRELPARRRQHGVLQLRAADLDDVGELLLLDLERLLQGDDAVL